MSIIKVLHVIDDKKFISHCQATFDIEGVENIICKASALESRLSEGIYDVIMVHFLRQTAIGALLNYKDKIPLVWFMWGGDAFNMGAFNNKYLTTKTRIVRIKLAFIHNVFLGFKTIFKDMFPKTIDWTEQARKRRAVMSKFDVVVPIIPEDFEILHLAYTIPAEMFHLNYVNPSVTAYETKELKLGSNILLGNSASFTNNHLDAIDILAKSQLGKRKVIIPVNYGYPLYGQEVEKYAVMKLGEKAVVLSDFIPLEEYNTLLNTCEIMIMNHFRQQALGNIVHALMNGITIYLSVRSVLYNFLKKNGFKVFEFDKGFVPHLLNEVELVHNRELCIKVFGKHTQNKKAKELITRVLALEKG